MKNKLTQEEQLLKAKVDEASFEYNDANWAEMQQMIGKKGFLSNYSPFIKAAAAFTILTVSVLLINEYYPSDESNNNLIEEASADKVENTIEIADENKIENNTTLSVEENAKPTETKPGNELSVKAFEKKDPKNPIEEEIKAEEIVFNELEEEPIEVTETVKKAPKIEITELNLTSAACIDSEIYADAKFKGIAETGINFKWFLNDKPIDGIVMITSFKVSNPGTHKLSIKVLYQEEVIDSKSISFNVEEKIDLDFNFKEIDNPFQDMDVQLTALPVGLKSLRWYENNSTEKVQFNNETTWTFENEGQHDITLAYKTDQGCIYDITKTVTVNKDFNPVFPEEFTPNGDGTNDVFTLEALAVANSKFHIQIFDLSNKLVYESTDLNEGWNGRFKNTGELLSNKKYAWIARIIDENGKQLSYKGKVTLRR